MRTNPSGDRTCRPITHLRFAAYLTISVMLGLHMVDQHQVRRSIRQQLLRSGFRVVYESTAVAHFSHPRYPGLLVRMGNTRIVGELHRSERYRSPLVEFDLDTMLAKVRADSAN